MLFAFSWAIISYQNITGNYNDKYAQSLGKTIISYQNITGNYNSIYKVNSDWLIISYQNITGNYNVYNKVPSFPAIISYQNITGNYNCSELMYFNLASTIFLAVLLLQVLPHRIRLFRHYILYKY